MDRGFIILCAILLFVSQVLAQRAGGGRGGGAGAGAGKKPLTKPSGTADKPQAVDAEGLTVPDTFTSNFFTCRKIAKDGKITEKAYDQCISFCCGGEVILKGKGMTCCGSEERGSPYKEGDLSCCSWWTGEGKAFDTKRVKHDHRYGCCGAHLIHHGLQGCCYGEGPPEPYIKGKETCCGSNKVRLTSFYGGATCCGNTAAYDKRRQSCPCGDGGVIDARIDETACCESTLGRKAPYKLSDQFCCNGAVGTNGVDFCCGSDVGRIGKEVCCDDIVVPIAPSDPDMKSCCGLKPFNPKKQMCCEGEIKPVSGRNSECCAQVPFNPAASICCEGNIWDKKKDGSACCGQYAYFPEKQSFCCKGVVYFAKAVKGNACCGDKFYDKKDGNTICCNEKLVKGTKKNACCDDVAYNTNSEICCMGNVFDKADGDICCHNVPYFQVNTTICCEYGPAGHFHNPACCAGNGYDASQGTVCCAGNTFEGLVWPSCCVDTGYDASRFTCCGATIYPNPYGSLLTGCCGEIDPQPYDIISEMCCEGNPVVIPPGIVRRQATCCGYSGIYDPGTDICCDEIIHPLESIYFTKCCGKQTYDARTQICCDAEDGSKPTIAKIDKFGESTSCCGNILYDAKKQYCCEGVLTKAQAGVNNCCAGKAFDQTKQICCAGKLIKLSKNVPWKKATCCGSGCMYDGPQVCCEDRVYMNNARSKRTCDVY